MRKKLAAVLLCMCMVLTLLPVSASAAGEYGLWVGGVQVDATTTTITGDGITGTVTYNNSTKTLTLDGATITGAHDFGQGTIGKAGIYYSGLSKLTIKLIGSNTITGQTAPRSSCGIFSDKAGVELEFTGSGNLNVTAAAENVDGGYSVPICSNGTITIAGEDTLTIVATSLQIKSQAPNEENLQAQKEQLNSGQHTRGTGRGYGRRRCYTYRLRDID